MNIAIFIYENAEVLDFSGPFEVFCTASRYSNPVGLFNVFLVAERLETVSARGGFRVNPAFSFADCPPIDVLIVAGGMHEAELRKPEVLEWIRDRSKAAGIVASVCTGVFILAEAGVLNRHTVTTHWDDISGLRNNYPELEVLENQRWIDEGGIVTSAGISAGMDMALHLVRRLSDQALAAKTARQMEYDWSDTA